MLLDIFSDKKREPAECIITLDGEEITELYPYLTEAVVETSRAQAATATLKFETRRLEDGLWSVQDDERLHAWAAITIEAAFGDTIEEIMRGYVRQIDLSYPADASATTVTVSCQDDSIGLDRQHHREIWGSDAPTSDRVIVETILGNSGLPVQLHPDSADGQSDLVVNQDCSDICLLCRRAEANDYELVFAEGQVYFGPPRLDGEPQATILVYAGLDTNCIRFDVKDDGHLPDRVGYDVAAETGAAVNSRIVAPNLPLLGKTPADSTGAGLPEFAWNMRREGLGNDAEMAAQAQHLANANSFKVRVEGDLDGSLYGHVLRVAEPVGVDGVGERYGGIYYVDSVSHRFDTAGYQQTFVLLRNAYGDNLEVSGNPLAGLL